ncbi:putative carboxylesterase [Lachnellula suecica]|uniref:Putative carboxylesterase n=1 Tax=Lachnellula suecica TaxID=602035 RepID=A0A8T9CFM0_9HELO|nr:putative carboxylesterase [Lachnellula suecica]
MSKFKYLRLKLYALTVRLLLRLQLGSPHPKPTNVIYVPSRGPGQRSIKSLPTPVLINFHGSGFILPMHGIDDLFCRRVADDVQYTVLDVQYRLAPENPWPAAHNDAEDVVKWVLKDSEQFDLTKIALSGFSAGAHIACVTSTVTFAPRTFCSLLAFYPATDLTIEPS